MIICCSTSHLNFNITKAQEFNDQIQSNVPLYRTIEAPNHRYDKVVFDSNPDSSPIKMEEYNSNINENTFRELSLPAAIEESINRHLITNNKSHNTSVYSSLLKFLYQMKQQFDSSKANQMKERLDDGSEQQVFVLPSKIKTTTSKAASLKEAQTTTTIPPETSIKSSVESSKNKLTTKLQPSISKQTTPDPMTTIFEVTSEPLDLAPAQDSIEGPTPSNLPAIGNTLVVTERSDDDSSTSSNTHTDSFTASDHIDDVDTLKSRFDRKRTQTISNQIKPQVFSPKYNFPEKVTPQNSLTLSPWSKRAMVQSASMQKQNKVPYKEDDNYNPDKSLFNFTPAPSNDVLKQVEFDNNDAGINGFHSIFDNLADINSHNTQRPRYSSLNEVITTIQSSGDYSQQPSHQTYDFYEPRPYASSVSSWPSKSKAKKSTSGMQKTRHSQHKYSASPNSAYGIKVRQLIKPGEYYNQGHPDTFAADSNDGRKYSAQASAYSDTYLNVPQQQNQPQHLPGTQPYQGIHLQQIYDPPMTSTRTYHIQQAPLHNGRAIGPPVFAAQTTTTYDNTVSRDQGQHNQKDLVHQPQTIQITAVPNAFPVLNGIRVNGYGINNGLVGNGLLGNGLFGANGVNGFLDPFGRQVVMVNAERRQIDWSFWIWPLLVVITLPLVLGALFVPVFLKTIIILIQVLQSLGLLLPITNALTNQITSSVSKASLVTGATQTVEQTKT